MAKILCAGCNTVLESKHVHDFVQCGCANLTFVDGGDWYLRCGAIDLDKICYWNEEKGAFERRNLSGEV